jgi:hypothetical protein
LFTDGGRPVNYKGRGKNVEGFPVHTKKRNPEVRLHTFLNSAPVNYEAFN